MPKGKQRRTAEFIDDVCADDGMVRRDALGALCPCRNNERDLDVWREVFNRARFGGRGERNAAAHAIGTLLQKAATNRRWRDVLKALEGDLETLMQDPRSASSVLGQMKRHGHAHRGAASQALRRSKRAMDLSSRDELAEWINVEFELDGDSRVGPSDPGLDRLWRWQRHRVRFQPERRTKSSELRKKAEQFIAV